MAASWFALGVMVIPFNDFYAFLPLGEMQSELSAYLFLPLIALVFYQRLRATHTARATTGTVSTTYLLPKLALAMFLVIAVSACINFPALLADRYQGRYPIEKFVSSAMVVAYGFALAWMTYQLVQRNSLHSIIIKPVCISIVVCAIFAALEILSATGGFAKSVYAISSNLTHLAKSPTGASPDQTAAWVTIGRARSVCFEPPALAAFAGAAWPWAYVGVATATKRSRAAYGLVLLLCSGLIIVAMSRTSAMLLFGNLTVYLLLRFVYLPPRSIDPRVPRLVSIVLALLATMGAVIVGFKTDTIASSIINSSDFSNVTRYGLITAGINMFNAHPMWGYGFGQFGFHYTAFLPSWAFRSWEVREYVVGARGWPPSFALLARFAAETGLAGMATWAGIWLLLVRAIWRSTLDYQHATGQLLILSYPLIMACICALLAGVAVDSVRAPMMWISMGAGCCYLQDVRDRLARLRGGAKVSVGSRRSPVFVSAMARSPHSADFGIPPTAAHRAGS